ncbi:MAG: HEAT repeat domain-containing protein [Lentisphaeria bacterium]|nr:HEAT repeat domain-containing protein [Lentisphaeria bacterium]
MNSTMDRQQHHDCTQRALALGRSGDPGALPELVTLLGMPATEIRRLAASAIGKLAEFGVDAATAVAALGPVALRDRHPQVQQYALKALKNFGADAECLLHDLDELAVNPRVKQYVSVAAVSASESIRAALEQAVQDAVHHCTRCGTTVAPDEYERAQQAFHRTYCDRCFDEVFLKRRNWETSVELKKTIQAADGTVVQSDGERIIAEELAALGMEYRYDNRFRIVKGYAIRPDFYLPELDLYIEYWGMEDNLDYRIGMLEKKKLYQQAGKRLLSLHAHDKPNLRTVLRQKLDRHRKPAL